MALRHVIVPAADRTLLRSLLARRDQIRGYPRTLAEDEITRTGPASRAAPRPTVSAEFAVRVHSTSGDLAVQVDDAITASDPSLRDGATCQSLTAWIAARSWQTVTALPAGSWSLVSARDGGAGSVDGETIDGASECGTDKVVVYAVLGQSNAMGADQEADLTNQSLLDPLTGVLFVHDITKIAEGVKAALESLGDVAFGAELSMARAILPTLGAREYLAILKVTRDGAGLVVGPAGPPWLPTSSGGPGERVTAFKERWDALVTHVAANYPEGTAVELRGAAWIQGEADAAHGPVEASTYASTMIALKDELFAHATLGASPKWVTPLFHTGLTIGSETGRANVDGGKASAASSDAQISTIGGTVGALFDGTHYDADSLMTLGDNLAAEFLA